jgi:fatty-acyl-CoA synthase
MWIEATTIGDLVDRTAAGTDGDALVFPDARVSYPELSALSDRLARSLRGLGVGPGEKVGILMPNCIDFVVAVVATAKLGAVTVPINGRFKATELDHVVSHADIRVLLTSAGAAGTGTDFPALIEETFPAIATQVAERLEVPAAPALRQVVDLGDDRPGFLTRAELDAAGEPVDLTEIKRLQERVRIRDVAVLMYTSGTTAKPKGCLLSHEGLVRHAFNLARTRFFLGPDDAFWDPLPLFHIGGFTPMLACFSAGATYVHPGHFVPDVGLRMLEEERVTVAYPAFEMIWLAIVNHPRFGEADLSAIRLVMALGTPERLLQLQRKVPWAKQVSSFGATESSSHVTLALPDDDEHARIATLGTPLPGIEIKIVDPETGADKPANEIGELLYRGYQRFEGYYKDPEQTAKAIDTEGWFHSGDLGSIDEQGRLAYHGRLKDMLKVGGENVSALEVEDYLTRHEAVNIVQVVAAPDARYDEVPAAFVELKPGAECSERELIEFCVGKIATFKVPRYVRFVEAWPMSGTKIQKFQLRDRIAKELADAGVREAPKIGSPTETSV